METSSTHFQKWCIDLEGADLGVGEGGEAIGQENSNFSN